MSEIVADHLKDRQQIKIYDPTSGSGSLLINIGHSVAKHMDNENNIRYYAQELKQNTYNLTRMNLVMRGISPNNIVTRNGDTLENDWPFFDENDPINSYNPLYVDAVVSNPPYSQKWDSSNKETDSRYARFGLAPNSKADYAFLLHDLFHIKPDGIMTIVLPHGVLFRGGEEGSIREKLVEWNHIDAIIGLPPNIFFGTGIPTIIMVLKQKRENTDVLFVDASKGFVKVGKNNKLRASDIKRIVDTVVSRKTISKYSKKVKRTEIRENEYNLNIPRYVDSSEPAESWDIYASMFGGIPEKEIDELEMYWEAFLELKEALFSSSLTGNAELKVEDAKETIKEHPSVKKFMEDFKISFEDFNTYLENELLINMESVNIAKEETILSEDIFKRLESIPLIDKYEAYQLLDNEWITLAVDLEIIQTEGFSVTRKVNPNMVIKKKKGKEQEVQEGWIGHIMPFELVQETYLKDELDKLRKKESRLLEISTEFEGILDSLSEEEKELETVNEAKNGFVTKAIAKEVKEIKTNIKKGNTVEQDSYEDKILKVEKLIFEEKRLKAEIKKESAELHLLTKDTIEKLTDNQVYELLELKWIRPLVTSLNNLPEIVINKLSDKVKKLSEKYATTYSDIAKEISETENILASLIDELVGDEDDMKGLSEFKSLLKGE
ncbi:type I restriction-modification system subunit M [Vallitalea sp. AN17-2]|uniref:Type I restriction-modification system subunit M n=1 Tax=Vallitalea maricola TaxID=3074433 RepID=A0ACB5UL38_9FIRM|nr:type I restriction-modification system subunit M [Vallitalea sp. AN17-2]